VWSTRSVTEMSVRNREGKGQPALKANNLTAICEPTVYNSGIQPGVGVPVGVIDDILRVCKIEEKNVREEHCIIRARFRVSHRRPGYDDIRSYHFALLKYLFSFINFCTMFKFSLVSLIHYFGCHLFNLF
jgi:hypothetical protein